MAGTPGLTPLRPEWSRLAAPIACGCCLVAGATYVVAAEPGTRSSFVPCPFRSLTGLWCPGCGLTRATVSLTQGDIGQALRYNVFVVVALAAIVIGWSMWTWQRLRDRRITLVPDRLRPWLLGVMIVMIVGYGVMRNLPGFDALRG